MSDAKRLTPEARTTGIDDWRRLVGEALKGRDISTLQSRSRDGFCIDPLYECRRDVESLPWRAGRKWALVQILDHPDPDAANEQALEDVEGGATGLVLRLAGGPSAAGLGLPPTAEALQIALQGIDLARVHLRLEPHPKAPQSARWLKHLIERSGVAPEFAAVASGLDPIAVLAFQGSEADLDPRDHVACFREIHAAKLQGPLASLDSRVYHEAGASEAQELAALLATAVWWLRALAEAGVPPDESMPRFGASLAVGHDQFLSIAKLRAVQLVWGRLQELCGVPRRRLPVHVETSRRMMTRADPMTNLLRTTVAVFAAGVGGADSVAVLPYDAALGLPTQGARSLARNMQHLLMEESHLHVVADPAAGSGAVEALTDAIAEHGWSEFQTIEREGGIVASLCSGLFQARIEAARAKLRAELASGAIRLVGATVHATPDEEHLVRVDTPIAAAVALAPICLEELARTAA
jgi:methylmalonyl-CoA mutase